MSFSYRTSEDNMKRYKKGKIVKECFDGWTYIMYIPKCATDFAADCEYDEEYGDSFNGFVFVINGKMVVETPFEHIKYGIRNVARKSKNKKYVTGDKKMRRRSWNFSYVRTVINSHEEWPDNLYKAQNRDKDEIRKEFGINW